MYVSSVLGRPDVGVGALQKPEERLMNACKDFTAIFVQQMLKEMRKSVPKSGLLDGGFAEDVYRDMFDAVMAEQAAHGGGFGRLAQALYDSFRPALSAQRSRGVEEPQGREAQRQNG